MLKVYLHIVIKYEKLKNIKKKVCFHLILLKNVKIHVGISFL